MEKDKIKNLIEKSGNNFHYQVVNFLREKGWSVLVSPYYCDNLTNKPREIDIIAEKNFDIKKTYRQRSFPVNTLLIRLFIECKYIPGIICFWFDNKDREKAIERILADTPLKPPDEYVLINKHHYLESSQVAKLSSSSKSNQDKDIFYTAINQSLNAMIYYRSMSPLLLKDLIVNREIRSTVNYPLILCNCFDNIYRVKGSDGVKISDNYFQVELNYVYRDKDKNDRKEYFLIDVVEFKKFGLFLEEALEKKDIGIIKETILEDIYQE